MSGIYKRKGSPYWWIWYKNEQKVIRESSKKKLKRDAKQVLYQKEDAARRNKYFKGRKSANDILLSDILQLYIEDYTRDNHSKINTKGYQERVFIAENILKFFIEYNKGVDIPAINIDVNMIDSFIEWRRGNKGKEIKAGTINKDLSCLRRSFNLAIEHNLLLTKPTIKLLKLNNVRSGMFEVWQVKKLIKNLPEYMRLIVWFAFNSAWRKEEILQLKWKNVDLINGVVFIEAQKTKNQRFKSYYMDISMKTHFEQLFIKMRKANKTNDNDYVFQNRYCKGKVKDFRYVWKKGLKVSNLPSNMLFHDLRRSAIKNMVDAGIPTNVCMAISGHRTREIFERYSIYRETEVKSVSIKVSKLLEQKIREKEKEDKRLEQLLIDTE